MEPHADSDGPFVTYSRVSTRRQGHSGLGLEAQRMAVAQYLNGRPVLAEFIEIQSGRSDRNRPQLQAALDLCRLTGARLVVSTLNRLSRDAEFLLRLQRESSDEEGGVKFVCADLPEANELSIGVLAVVAQYERKQIVTNVTAALAAAKERGMKRDGTPFKTATGRLGPTPKGIRAIKEHGDRGRALAVVSIQKKADAFARRVAPVIRKLQVEGIRTQAALADALNRRGIRTSRGNGKVRYAWNPAGVGRVLKRLR
jgi:DNA invertase Pin-like site-specific DNA recombinase